MPQTAITMHQDAAQQTQMQPPAPLDVDKQPVDSKKPPAAAVSPSPSWKKQGALGPAPDGGLQAWSVVLGSFLIQFCCVGGFYVFGVFVLLYVDEFQVGRDAVAVGGALQALGFMMMSPLIGRLGDIYGSRFAIILGGSIIIGGWVLDSFATEAWQMYLTHGVMVGFGSCIQYSVSASVVAHWFDKNRGMATSLAVAGGGVGNIALAPMLQALFDRIGWRMAIRVLAAVFAGCTVCGAILCKRRYPTLKGKDAKLLNLDFSVLKLRDFKILALNFCVFQCAFFVPLHHLAASSKDKGLDSGSQALIIAMIGVGNATGRLTTGIFADRMGAKRCGMFCQFITGVVTGLWPLCFNEAGYAVAAFFFGCFGCAFWALLPLLVAHVVGVQRLGSCIGMIFPSMIFGTLAASPFAGFLYEQTGTYIYSAELSAFFFIGSAAVLSLLSDTPVDKRVSHDG